MIGLLLIEHVYDFVFSYYVLIDLLFYTPQSLSLVLGEWSEETSETQAESTATGDPTKAEATQVAKVKAKPKDLSAQLKKEHVNIVFIGHVDAGKSTIGGRVL